MNENIIDSIDEIDDVSNNVVANVSKTNNALEILDNDSSLENNINSIEEIAYDDAEELLEETIFTGFTPVISDNILEKNDNNPPQVVENLENVEKEIIANKFINNSDNDIKVDVIMPNNSEEPTIKEANIDTLDLPDIYNVEEENIDIVSTNDVIADSKQNLNDTKINDGIKKEENNNLNVAPVFINTEVKGTEEVEQVNKFIPIADNSSLETNNVEVTKSEQNLNENVVSNDLEESKDNDSQEQTQEETEKKVEKKEDNEQEIESDSSKKNEDSLLERYGENFSIKKYVCNPAIGRDNEIKQLILTLLTPEKSGILVGKPGIGKTAIVEGLGYQIQQGNVPDALKEYQIYKLNTSSLLGVMPGTNEPKIQVLLNEIKGQNKLILFIDEIHTLIGAGSDGDDSLDFANIFKPGLDRGNIKIIGATTSDEYDRYILTDKAFVRRFQKIDVLEPTKEHTVEILMGSLPKLEHKTGAKLKYTTFVQEKIMTFIVELTSEYRRVYELSARYPDVALTILQQAFSYAVFENKKEVSIRDVRKAINNTKLVYPDVIKKELVRFNELFTDIYRMETIQRLKGETSL